MLEIISVETLNQVYDEFLMNIKKKKIILLIMYDVRVYYHILGHV